MKRLLSTMEVALSCVLCGKTLKETEAYFFSKCSECVYRESRHEDRHKHRRNEDSVISFQ